MRGQHLHISQQHFKMTWSHRGVINLHRLPVPMHWQAGQLRTPPFCHRIAEMEHILKPLKLKLSGFIGIAKGLGKDVLELDLTTIPAEKQLVALVGPNGRAKTTILDNLQPYRVMPSRSTTLGPGGFSYWDHFFGLSAAKELYWEHGLRRYFSNFSFKTKARKADYYLYSWNEESQDWEPYVTPEGVRSDGKAETYDKCVESILGSPERFFTSQFAAQHRKALSSYGDADVKSLLASMLNHKLFGQLKVKAGMVIKLLKFQLDSLQEDLSQARAADAGIEENRRLLEQHELGAQGWALKVKSSDEACAVARTKLANLEAKRDAQTKDLEEANFLRSQIAAASASAQATKVKLQEQLTLEQTRSKTEIDALQVQVSTARQDLKNVEAELDRLNSVLSNKDRIEQAAASLPSVRSQIQVADDRCSDIQIKLGDLVPLRKRFQALNEQLANIQAAGEGKKLMLGQLIDTAALVDVVPCKGLAMQTSCQLLAHANDAKNKIPTDTVAFEQLRKDYKAVKTEIANLREQLNIEASLQAEIEQATKVRKGLQLELDSLHAWAARSELLQIATSQLPERRNAKQNLIASVDQAAQRIALQRQAIDDLRATHALALREVEQRLSEETKILEQRLNLLATPVSQQEIALRAQELTAAERIADECRARQQAHNESKASLLAKNEVLTTMKERSTETIAQAGRLQDEIADWRSIEKGMDGLVALSIDDAGPEISQICNELLADDMEGRFTVRLDTQRELASGNQKETFDIMVFDSRGGESTPISMMSGGEKVWVNECLTRAIALHISDSGTKGYQTLFTDETDGAFDPDRKRNFMQMKRKVLQRGGYEREYFISQTPEVWELADHIIHMDTL